MVTVTATKTMDDKDDGRNGTTLSGSTATTARDDFFDRTATAVAATAATRNQPQRQQHQQHAQGTNTRRKRTPDGSHASNNTGNIVQPRGGALQTSSLNIVRFFCWQRPALSSSRIRRRPQDRREKHSARKTRTNGCFYVISRRTVPPLFLLVQYSRNITYRQVHHRFRVAKFSNTGASNDHPILRSVQNSCAQAGNNCVPRCLPPLTCRCRQSSGAPPAFLRRIPPRD